MELYQVGEISTIGDFLDRVKGLDPKTPLKIDVLGENSIGTTYLDKAFVYKWAKSFENGPVYLTVDIRKPYRAFIFGDEFRVVAQTYEEACALMITKLGIKTEVLEEPETDAEYPHVQHMEF